jgi:hypothetical protein
MLNQLISIYLMDELEARRRNARNIRTGLILLSVVVAFFVGMILRHWP